MMMNVKTENRRQSRGTVAMRTLVLLTLGLGLAIGIVFSPGFTHGAPVTRDQGEQTGITICHCPPGNPGNCRTITINPAALPAHLAHGDTLGPCDEGDSLPVRTLVKEQLTANALGSATIAVEGEPGFLNFDTLTVSDIGLSGEDGVALGLGHDAARWSAILRDESGAGEFLNGTVEIHAVGVVDDAPNQLATILRIESSPGGGLITADFSPIGSDQQQILVLLGEGLVAFLTDLSATPGIQLVLPVPNLSIDWCQFAPDFFENCGWIFHSGPPTNPNDLGGCRYEVQFGRPVLLILPTGETVEGDRVVIAEQEGPDSIDMRIFSEMRVLVADVETFSISDQRVQAVDDE